jgi:hypothetical protein
MDVVVTVPRQIWWEWMAEGDLPGDEPSGAEYHYFVGAGVVPQMQPGDRVYIVAHNRLRGYAPLVKIEYPLKPMQEYWWPHARFALVRKGEAQAVTIDEQIRGFRGWRYRWWQREDEYPFPEWETEGVKR